MIMKVAGKFLFACFAITVLVTSNSAFAAKGAKSSLSKVCPNVIEGTSATVVYKTNAPVRKCAAHTCPIAYFRQEPTLIMKQRVNLSYVSVYASNGTKVASCPWASAHGFAGGRYRCTVNTGAVTSAAIRASKSPALYFPIKGNRCIRVPNGRSCIGSSHC